MRQYLAGRKNAASRVDVAACDTSVVEQCTVHRDMRARVDALASEVPCYLYDDYVVEFGPVGRGHRGWAGNGRRRKWPAEASVHNPRGVPARGFRLLYFVWAPLSLQILLHRLARVRQAGTGNVFLLDH